MGNVLDLHRDGKSTTIFDMKSSTGSSSHILYFFQHVCGISYRTVSDLRSINFLMIKWKINIITCFVGWQTGDVTFIQRISHLLFVYLYLIDGVHISKERLLIVLSLEILQLVHYFAILPGLPYMPVCITWVIFCDTSIMLHHISPTILLLDQLMVLTHNKEIIDAACVRPSHNRWLIVDSFFIWCTQVIPFACNELMCVHYNDVIMGAMTSQITCLTIAYSAVYSGRD